MTNQMLSTFNKGVDFTGITIVFFCHDGKGNFLFNKRSNTCRDEHGRWDPGGGGLEFGDTIEQTLEKEIKEEYCTEVLEAEFLGFRDVHRTDEKGNKTHWLALDYKVLVDPEMVTNGEPKKFDQIGWFRLNNLPQPLHSQTPFALQKYGQQLAGVDEMVQPIGCVVIVKNKLGQILLGKRKGSYKAGYFGMPGGRVDSHEQLEACAKRELEEETGLVAKKLTYVGVVKEWQESYHFIHFIYVCETWDGEPKVMEPDKCEDWEWFAQDELPEKVLLGHLKGIELMESEVGVVDF
jgi:mutator protein MutT